MAATTEVYAQRIETTAGYPDFRRSIYALGLVGFFVLIHSYYLHRRYYDFIRICTDVAALSCCISAFLTYVAYGVIKTVAGKAFMYYIVADSTHLFILFLMDFLVMYERYRAIQRVRYHSVGHFVVGFFMGVTYVSSYAVWPLFYEPNSSDANNMINTLSVMTALLNLCYRLYIIIRCLFILVKIVRFEKQGQAQVVPMPALIMPTTIPNNSNENVMISDNTPTNNTGEQAATGGKNSNQQELLVVNEVLFRSMNLPDFSGAVSGQSSGGSSDPLNQHQYTGRIMAEFPEARLSPRWLHRVRVITIKTLGHGVTSIFGLLIGLLPQGTLIVRHIILVGLHFWFNWRLEDYLCPMPEDPQQMSVMRGERERRAIHAERRRREEQAKIDAEDRAIEVIQRHNQQQQQDQQQRQQQQRVRPQRSFVPRFVSDALEGMSMARLEPDPVHKPSNAQNQNNRGNQEIRGENHDRIQYQNMVGNEPIEDQNMAANQMEVGAAGGGSGGVKGVTVKVAPTVKGATVKVAPTVKGASGGGGDATGSGSGSGGVATPVKVAPTVKGASGGGGDATGSGSGSGRGATPVKGATGSGVASAGAVGSNAAAAAAGRPQRPLRIKG